MSVAATIVVLLVATLWGLAVYKRLVADLTLDKVMLQEVLAKED